MMKDVGQCEENGGLSLHLPLRAFLLHQSTFLWWGERRIKPYGEEDWERTPASPPRPWLTTGSSSTLSTAWKQPSNLCALTRSAHGGSCRGRKPATG